MYNAVEIIELWFCNIWRIVFGWSDIIDLMVSSQLSAAPAHHPLYYELMIYEWIVCRVYKEYLVMWHNKVRAW